MVLDSVSWGEVIVLVGVGLTVIGRKDLPAASKAVGVQVGRVVGLLVGGRQRLDKYAVNNELTKLQNELRMGLRELDAIKTEMAVASSAGMMGRNLGSTTTLGTRPPQLIKPLKNERTPLLLNADNLMTLSSSPSVSSNTTKISSSVAIKAVAEHEWQKRGIGFKSRAEQGTFGAWAENNSTSSERSSHTSNTSSITGGASILAELIQENLIYDQYDRVTQEQQDILRPKSEQKNVRGVDNTKNDQ